MTFADIAHVMDHPVKIANVRVAQRAIDPVFLDTPLHTGAALDAALGCRLFAKDETNNPLGSFKGRGADWFASTALKRGEGIVCASAGNFGQALARAATRRGHTCTVFVSEHCNPFKIAAMERCGAQLRFAGADFDAAKCAARRYAIENKLRWVEDGAEPAFAEGAATIALELIEPMDTILVPLGNGALLAGMGAAIRHLAPRTRIIAVVAERAPAMKLSIEAGRPVETEHADTIADGIAVRVPIPSTLPYLRQCCDAVVAVSESAIFDVMRMIHRHLDLLIEPAGAVGVAAILSDPGSYAGQRVATILSGGNLSEQMRAKLLGESPDNRCSVTLAFDF